MNRSRPKQIVIRLSEKEFETIKNKVNQSGKTQQEYIIEALTKAQIVNFNELKTIYLELNRQGNNLNQMAKLMNRNNRNVELQELEEALKEVSEIWRSLKPYLQKQV